MERPWPLWLTAVAIAAFGGLLVAAVFIWFIVDLPGPLDEVGALAGAGFATVSILLTGAGYRKGQELVASRVVKAGQLADAFNADRFRVRQGTKTLHLSDALNTAQVIQPLLDSLRRSGEIEAARELAGSLHALMDEIVTDEVFIKPARKDGGQDRGSH